MPTRRRSTAGPPTERRRDHEATYPVNDRSLRARCTGQSPPPQHPNLLHNAVAPRNQVAVLGDQRVVGPTPPARFAKQHGGVRWTKDKATQAATSA